jgi:hypothetical protein
MDIQEWMNLFGMEPVIMGINDITPYARNAKIHNDEQVTEIAASIKEFGFRQPIAIDQNNVVRAGHGRLLAARRLGMEQVPCARGNMSEAKWRAYGILDNRSNEKSSWDKELMKVEMDDLRDSGIDISLTGFSENDFALFLERHDGPILKLGEGDVRAGVLSLRFGVPPVTVLDARSGWWIARKRAWLATGIKSHLGRKDNLLGGSRKKSGMYMKKIIGKDPATGKVVTQRQETGSSSVFDPCLCELLYRWFCPVDGVVLDPFAGGSVRGIVASKLGRHYVGIDLREEQVEENRKQGADMCRTHEPKWVCGDSAKVVHTLDVHADFLMSCPPYADLEKYSKDPDDLSNMPYAKFIDMYEKIIAESCAKLKPDSFAAWVVGDIRDKESENGHYRNFVGDTVAAFKKAGLELYNEAILVTPIASVRMICGKTFENYRKLSKTHQNVFVFVKGNANKAVAKIGPVEFGEPPEEEIDEDIDQGEVENVTDL